MNVDAESPGAKRKNIIAVLDDEVEVCKALRRLLRSAGYEVETFVSGRQFLEALPSQSPACLVLDLHLPGLTGLDVLRHLTATQTGIPTIVITGRDEPGLEGKIMAAGAAAFFLKPVNDEGLLNKLNELRLPRPQ